MAHAKLGPSAAHRWLHCPGSVHAEAGIKDKPSAHSVEGTVAHALAERCLVEDSNPWALVGEVLDGHDQFPVDNEMAGHVADYIAYLAELPGEAAYECKVDYGEWVEGGWGTADAIIVDEADKTLHVADLKYGKGIRVDAERNPQLMLYALGALAEYELIYDVEWVYLHVCQPRLDHWDSCPIGADSLREWAMWVSDQADRTKDPKAPRVPGESQCKWCKAKATCPELKEYTERLIAAEFDDLDGMPAPKNMTDDQLRKVMDGKALVEGWLSAVEQHVAERLHRGETFPGYKLVAGRSQRRWSDEEQAAETLQELIGDVAFERKLLSPAKAEKALGKGKAAQIAELITKPEGKPTIAPESDKRPPVGVTVDDFEG